MISCRYYLKNGSKNEDMEDLEKHKIATWREELEQDGSLKPLVSISPSERFSHILKFKFR